MNTTARQERNNRIIGIWLMIGVVMILIQVAIGGITRLTESGLSITEWDVVSGTLPPLNQADWESEFALYKASPQYQKVNKGMSLDQFKFIYFWEWFHRLWARLLGFVFLIPFVYFLVKKMFTRQLMIKAGVAFLLGGLVGIFGWIMVASGLHDRPMVSPYRLAMHLSLAIITLLYLFWVAMQLLVPKDAHRVSSTYRPLRQWGYALITLVAVQVIFGALVSGMRAAPFYPTWPDMNGYFIPLAMQEGSNWSLQSFLHFDQHPFPAAFVQFVHRNLAYIITVLVVIFLVKGFQTVRTEGTRWALRLIPVVLTAQVLLGIFTLLYTKGSTPVGLGVIHQNVAILLLMSLFFFQYKITGKGSRPLNTSEVEKQQQHTGRYEYAEN